jgi:hypothetical protein
LASLLSLSLKRWVGAGLLVSSATFALAAGKTGKGVEVISDEAHRRVDITVDGAAFTSYVWPTSLKKPVLYPLTMDGGVEVTRGYPLSPRPGERQDHPHHAGMWFNYGNVNGFDFWNNSDAIPAENRAKMGTIEQRKIVSTKSGKDSGELVVESVWITGEKKELLKETDRYVFSRKSDVRTIDQEIKLEALDRAVFHDDKEGLLGIRVARWLESANEKGGIFTDADGRQTKVDGASGAGATGVYLTSEGKEGDAVWSTRGRWCALTGTNPEGKTAMIAIFDYPKNPGYPAYWHARGYGLFAVNPLGAKIFDPAAPQMDYTLEKGKSASFRYRVMLVPHAMDAAAIDKEARTFEGQ